MTATVVAGHAKSAKRVNADPELKGWQVKSLEPYLHAWVTSQLRGAFGPLASIDTDIDIALRIGISDASVRRYRERNGIPDYHTRKRDALELETPFGAGPSRRSHERKTA